MKLYGKDLLKALSDVSAPSGNEDRAAELIIEQIGDDAEVSRDRVGNVIAKIPSCGGKEKIMICAHMDEPGFIVKDIDGDGKVWFKLFGGVPTERISGRLGVINGNVRCIFSAKPIHALSGDERSKPTAADKIYAEIGAKNKENAEKLVSIGDYGTLAPSFGDIGGYVKGKALGSRAACAVLIETIRAIKSGEIKSENELYFAFTTRGEIGTTGADVAAYVIAPTKGIVVDGIYAYDTPGVSKESKISELGMGAVIMLADSKTIFSRRLSEECVAYAEKNGIKYQYVMRQAQVGEGCAVQRALGGCECLGISIPVRYKKSASEMVSEADIKTAVAIISSQL